MQIAVLYPTHCIHVPVHGLNTVFTLTGVLERHLQFALWTLSKDLQHTQNTTGLLSHNQSDSEAELRCNQIISLVLLDVSCLLKRVLCFPLSPCAFFLIETKFFFTNKRWKFFKYTDLHDKNVQNLIVLNWINIFHGLNLIVFGLKERYWLVDCTSMNLN